MMLVFALLAVAVLAGGGATYRWQKPSLGAAELARDTAVPGAERGAGLVRRARRRTGSRSLWTPGMSLVSALAYRQIVLQLVVSKDLRLEWPRIETKTH